MKMSHGKITRPAKIKRLVKRHDQGKHNIANAKGNSNTKCPLCA